ncbi:MAG: thioredoxin fold domain-containing protein [Rhodomicrobium sp.]|nr:thioredoxin fold domain-containing protein [Rhodomicrobium sp.]
MTHTKQISALCLSRRTFIASAGATLLAGSLPAFAAPQLRLDGLYEESWLVKTTGDLGKDFAAAATSKKNFAIAWEMRGCPWCKRLHMENFARPDIAAYMQDNFALLQLNIRGSRELTDFDGAKLPEESLSLKYNVMSTPAIQFFKPSDAARGRELGRIGYLKPDDFLAMLRFVREKGYEKQSFEDWVKSHKNPA